MQLNGLGQLSPGVATLLMAHHQRFAIGVLRDRSVEGLANCHGQQRFVLSATAVALIRLIHNDPFCLFCKVDGGCLT